MKIAFITGITGQDGSYLAEFLLEKGYIVHGMKRRSSSFNTGRIDHIYQDPHTDNKNFILHYGDMTDSLNITQLIKKINPTEIYNLAAQSHVAVSFDTPEYTANVDALGTLRLLESIKTLGLKNTCKFYQASTSELYGHNNTVPQNERTPFYPKSPYAVAKLFSYWITINYREAYDMYACNGILYNHESERRGETFLTRKVTMAISNIVCKNQTCLYVGNLESLRDWGHAKDYVEMQWLMLQQNKAEDFVISSGQQITVRRFIEEVCREAGIDLEWQGKKLNEVGIVSKIHIESHIKPGDIIVRVDERHFRPLETPNLLGDSSYAREKLGWKTKIGLKEMIRLMFNSDMKAAKARYIINSQQT